MRRRKQDRYDRRPWAIRDTLGASAEIRSWHKSNAGTLAKMLDERDHQPGRWKVYDRTKEKQP